jgi:adenosine deaminase
VHSDLHRHLDGSLRPATVDELARKFRLSVPADLVFTSKMGLGAALSRFEFLLKLLQQPAEVRRVAAEICEDALAEKVTTLEIRFAPQLHRGASLEAIVEAAIEGANGRAGIILCGLYGEPPSVLNALVEIARARREVVGIDLAGAPGSGDNYRLLDYVEPFQRAADLGIGRTVHAGEGRPAREIADAILHLRAQRIGHGVTLLDDPAVVELVLQRGVTLEACITSNLHTGVIDSAADHPLPQWLARGIRCCINTDNTLLSATTLQHELSLAPPSAHATLGEFGRAAAFSRA